MRLGLTRPLLLLACFCAGNAPAMEIETAPAYVLAAGQTQSNQLFLTSVSARLDGQALDDVFAMAQTTIDVSGDLAGDAWLLGRTINLGGRVGDHVRALGEAVTLRGELMRSLAAMATTVHLATGSVIRGDVAAAGDNVILEGRVDGSVQIVAKAVTLGGHIAGDVRLLAQDIVVLPGTVIQGNLAYTSSRELFLDHTVQLGGKLTRQEARADARRSARAWVDFAVFKMMQMVAAFLVGLPLLLLFPRLVGRSTRLLRYAMPRAMMTGVAALFLLPLAAIVAFVTVVGIPLSLALLALYGILLYCAKIVVALALAGLLLPRQGTQQKSAVIGLMALGLAMLYAASSLPAIGGSLALLVGILGLGALCLALLGADARRPAHRDAPVAADSTQPPGPA